MQYAIWNSFKDMKMVIGDIRADTDKAALKSARAIWGAKVWLTDSNGKVIN